MALYWKVAGGVLVALILAGALGKQEKDLALMLCMSVCVMTMTAAFSILEPVLEFFRDLERLGDFHSETLTALLKITGIGLVSEIAGNLCADSGNAALERGIRLLGTAVILSLSLPILETLLDLIQIILGEL